MGSTIASGRTWVNPQVVFVKLFGPNPRSHNDKKFSGRDFSINVYQFLRDSIPPKSLVREELRPHARPEQFPACFQREKNFPKNLPRRFLRLQASLTGWSIARDAGFPGGCEPLVTFAKTPCGRQFGSI
jgi:hypothetical protein